MKTDIINALKKGLLEHYADKEPRRFIQIDGWHFADGGSPDTLHETDADGDCLNSGITTELMIGADIRILINPESPQSEVVALLRKAIDWIERDNLVKHADPAIRIRHS